MSLQYNKYYLNDKQISLSELAKLAGNIPLTTMWSRLHILKKTPEEAINFKIFNKQVFTLSDGETATVKEFAERYNVTVKCINHRYLQENWTIENAIKNLHHRHKIYKIDDVELTLAQWCRMYKVRIISVLSSLNRGKNLEEALMSRKNFDKDGKTITQKEICASLYEKAEEYICTENITLTSQFRRKNKKLYIHTSESGLIPLLVQRGFLRYG